MTNTLWWLHLPGHTQHASCLTDSPWHMTAAAVAFQSRLWGMHGSCTNLPQSVFLLRPRSTASTCNCISAKF